MNLVILTGNVGADPEVKEFDSGAKVVSLNLATTKKYKDKSGEMQSKTEWHRLKAWNKTAELIQKWIKKGSKIGIEGELQYSMSENNGQKTYYTDIIVNRIEFLGGGNSSENKPQQQTQNEKPKQQTQNADFEPQEDDLPF